jgi:hypothetical protein
MTLRRATLYVAGGTLLVAWFSSAASMSLGRSSRRARQVIDDSAPAQNLAVSVQTQARRLKERLAVAPLPQEPVRNPFAFRPAPEIRVAPPPRAGVPVPTTAPVEMGVPDLPLLLVGLAEHRHGDVLVQSAVISSNGEDLIMAEVGSVVVGRYTVTSIGSDAVEMKDASTGRIRRLVLQNQNR